jgi:hypothetical protein
VWNVDNFPLFCKNYTPGCLCRSQFHLSRLFSFHPQFFSPEREKERDVFYLTTL